MINLVGMRRFGRTSLLASFGLCFTVLAACAPSGGGANDGGDGGNGGNGGGGGVTGDSLRVSFSAEGGNFAVAEDEGGNEYAFRAREDGSGNTTITEANVRTSGGAVLKASLDNQGRPVNFRLADNTNADIVYENGTAMIRVTSPNGTITEGTATELTSDSAQDVPATEQTNPSDSTELLRDGLDEYKKLVTLLFDDSQNPDSPLADSEFDEAAMLIGAIADEFDVEEVLHEELANATLDKVPPTIQMLAGQTFILFDAEGLCLAQTGAANNLTFDLNGVLQSEFDRNVVFPDFGLGETRDAGVTVNYSTFTPINLTPTGTDVSVFVTPVFTGTQLDEFGFITIERRFQVDSTYLVDSFAGTTAATAAQLFDAALTNGTLSDDGSLLEFELYLVDLKDENPVRRVGMLRYRNQNSAEADTVFNCDVIDSYEDGYSGINCPGSTGPLSPFSVEYVFSREDEGRTLSFEWFVSDGLGFVTSDPFDSQVEVLPTGDGLIEVSVIVSDYSDGDEGIFKQYSCQSIVGDFEIVGTEPAALSVGCPAGMNVGDLGLFNAEGFMVDSLQFGKWFVFGSRAYSILEPDLAQTEIEFYQAGRFEVGYSGFDANGQEFFSFCEVVVGMSSYDLCEVNAYYGDGICDEFCAQPDEDCGSTYFDFCEVNGYYGDGVCDPYCSFEDTEDCSGEFADLCETEGFYGDGTCDLFCAGPDPDCDEYDVCAAYGWYGDGICDFCSRPDPDCDTVTDLCADRGWYGDGECDSFCSSPDPDCETEDVCLMLGWYGDGTCDDFCKLPDTDCSGVTDLCAINGQYGDGVCDEGCEYPDLDCPDACAESGLYGDGLCDGNCLYPDPDCETLDDCAAMNFYGDGICDAFCVEPDPDCDDLGASDICETNGFYGDGTCDDFCDSPDPDCGQ